MTSWRHPSRPARNILPSVVPLMLSKRIPSVLTVKRGSGIMVNSFMSPSVKQMPRMITSIDVVTTSKYLICGWKMSGIGRTSSTANIDSNVTLLFTMTHRVWLTWELVKIGEVMSSLIFPDKDVGINSQPGSSYLSEYSNFPVDLHVIELFGQLGRQRNSLCLRQHRHRIWTISHNNSHTQNRSPGLEAFG